MRSSNVLLTSFWRVGVSFIGLNIAPPTLAPSCSLLASVSYKLTFLHVSAQHRPASIVPLFFVMLHMVAGSWS